jgi:hypothetical protein
MYKVEDGDFIKFHFHHMPAPEFTAFGKRMDQRLIEVEDQRFL